MSFSWGVSPLRRSPRCASLLRKRLHGGRWCRLTHLLRLGKATLLDSRLHHPITTNDTRGADNNVQKGDDKAVRARQTLSGNSATKAVYVFFLGGITLLDSRLHHPITTNDTRGADNNLPPWSLLRSNEAQRVCLFLGGYHLYGDRRVALHCCARGSTEEDYYLHHE
jgi:hypothetical protein